MHRLVRHLDMQGLRIGVRVHRHGRHTHAAGSTNDPAGNLAPVGDEDFREHQLTFAAQDCGLRWGRVLARPGVGDPELGLEHFIPATPPDIRASHMRLPTRPPTGRSGEARGAARC